MVAVASWRCKALGWHAALLTRRHTSLDCPWILLLAYTGNGIERGAAEDPRACTKHRRAPRGRKQDEAGRGCARGLRLWAACVWRELCRAAGR